MFTVLIVAAAIALVFLMFNKPKPPTSGPTPAPVFDFSQLAAVRQAEPASVPDRRMQLISKRLQDVEDERLTNDAIDDLIGTRPKPAARSAPAAS
jgi:hypothetical protein